MQSMRKNTTGAGLLAPRSAEKREHAFADDVVAHRGPHFAGLLASGGGRDPAWVLPLDEPREGLVGAAVLVVEDLAHALVGALEVEVEPDELLVDLHPLGGRQRPAEPSRELSESLEVILLHLLAADAVALQEPLAREEDLLGVDRLDEVVRDLPPDGVLHQVLLLGLRDHHDGRLGAVLLDPLQRVQPTQPGHLLVQEDDVEAVALDAVHGVGAVGDGLDVEALGFEEEDVRLEEVDLVVGPEDAGHGGRVEGDGIEIGRASGGAARGFAGGGLWRG